MNRQTETHTDWSESLNMNGIDWVFLNNSMILMIRKTYINVKPTKFWLLHEADFEWPVKCLK